MILLKLDDPFLQCFHDGFKSFAQAEGAEGSLAGGETDQREARSYADPSRVAGGDAPKKSFK